MARRITGLGLACLMVLFVSNFALAADAEVKVLEYPTKVSAGETIKVKVGWKNVPTNKDYILRTQLEDWETKPPVCIFKDTPITTANDETVVTLTMPKAIVATNTAKFIAAFISKTKDWSDTLVSSGTESNIILSSDFQFEIVDFPASVTKGSTVKVKVAWKGIAAGKDYKLIVQLENWKATPGFAYVATIADVKSSDERVVDIHIPANAAPAKNCRWLAAFISKTKEWGDAFAVVSTKEEIEVK
ncbi:MAG: hypothetical protein Q8R05_05455 [Candidatus Omnitrophota bacterium]|nr:hypothetical protein [Candidatus Omnitrophota bacterium]